jgi:riboflavin synthase
MFTGIIRDIGTVRTAQSSGGGLRLSLSTAFVLGPSDIGASIACAGCCLTVVAVENDAFTVDVSVETLSKTTIGGWGLGRRVNLERSLRLGDEMGGHMVSGHVDGLAILDTVRPDGGCWRMDFSVPEALACFLAPKGSVALDGVSLTVNEVDANRFGVAIIPHTWTHTTLGTCRPGERLNLEVDLMARYAARILGLHQTRESPA